MEIRMDIIETEVLLFFKKALNKKIQTSSYLNDYCKNEDDAFYLIYEFFDKFNIEKGNLNLDKYFNYKRTLYDKLFFKNVSNKITNKPKITISHMIEVAKRKEWFEPSSSGVS